MCVCLGRSRQAAFHLYKNTLGYAINAVERAYYADGEDAYDMRKMFNEEDKPKSVSFAKYEGEERKKREEEKAADDADTAEASASPAADGVALNGNGNKDAGAAAEGTAEDAAA